MPPPKKANPKEKFYEHGQELLNDAQNSPDPELKKLRLEAAKRYFAEDALGEAKVSPVLALIVGIVVLVILAAVTIYVSTHFAGAISTLVLIACAFFAIIVLLLVFALTGVMPANTLSKTIIGIWSKLLSKFQSSE
jgi:preprotein translocase subunit Sec61beta